MNRIDQTHPASLLGRRTLLKRGCAAGVGVWLPACVRTAVTSPPLPIPPVLEPTSVTADADIYDLTMTEGTVQLFDGEPTRIWGYNGMWPGPTIAARRGRTTIVRQHNDLPERMSVHLHGANTPPSSDGHPNDFFEPGETKEYVYPNEMGAATLWYHDHVIDRTAYHVAMGLAGYYLLSDEEEDAQNLPTGDYDIPLLLQDRRFDHDNQIFYLLNRRARAWGYIGDTMCVNGAIFPHLDVANVRYRFRLLNGSNARMYRLALDSGDPFVVVGSDGGLLERPVEVRALDIFPGERFDVIVDFSNHGVGKSIVLKNILNLDDDPIIEDVMRFDVVRTETDQFDVPERLRTIEPLRLDEVAQVRSFDTRADEHVTWTINGLSFDGARVDAYPVLGSTEIWEFEKPGLARYHPMHIHLVQFQVLDFDGRPPPPHLAGWKDTIAVLQGKTRVIAKFEDRLGLYLFHCHILEHEDHHMMAQFEVVPGA